MQEASKFYEWMLKIKSVHLANNTKMSEAYEKIIKNEKETKVPNNERVFDLLSSGAQ
jgi:hypothetical protein